jgi:hypothetical protein
LIDAIEAPRWRLLHDIMTYGVVRRKMLGEGALSVTGWNWTSP